MGQIETEGRTIFPLLVFLPRELKIFNCFNVGPFKMFAEICFKNRGFRALSILSDEKDYNKNRARRIFLLKLACFVGLLS